MAIINGHKILSVVQTKYLLNGISLKNAVVNGTTLQITNNYVQATTLYSFDTSVVGTTLEITTSNITDNTLILI